ncbi:hypothetical protein MPSEU_000320500 [Mayamaea pseudoterrestris]|nr:hypothetical protein MPSEU_000320500 [Mayamaea pseudoterrestris]
MLASTRLQAVYLCLLSCSLWQYEASAFHFPLSLARSSSRLSAASGSSSTPSSLDPIAFGAGASTKSDLVQAITEAVSLALDSLPRHARAIDLGLVSVSSLYDGGIHPVSTTVVPAILAALQVYHDDQTKNNNQQSTNNEPYTLKNLMGSTVAGCIASVPSRQPSSSSFSKADASTAFVTRACQPIEYEGVPAVSITLCVLPDCSARVFHVSAADLPDDPDGQVSLDEWKRIVGLKGFGDDDDDDDNNSNDNKDAAPPSFLLVPHPAFATDLDDFLSSLATYFPNSPCVGGIASTVSSLSRAKLFLYAPGASTTCHADGCVGVALCGDVRLEQRTALGAKPVGGIYQIVKGQDATINAIVLDETATEALHDEEDDDDDDSLEETEENEADMTKKERLIASYAKARIPKPPLAEANFVMRTLSDDDQAFMRRVLLVGLDQGAGGIGRTASELARLAQGEGHRFTVKQVASGGMKDGSVTFPLGSVNIKAGTRMRFFVRESSFAKKEIKALWTGYKKSILDEQFQSSNGASSTIFEPAACFVIPTLDRGNKFFLGKAGYESNAVATSLPGVPCIAGFFSNGVIGQIDKSENKKVGVQGSASSYILIGSRSGRPIYSPASAASDEASEQIRLAAQKAEATRLAAEDEKRQQRMKTHTVGESEAAPRNEQGELILKRREVHAGRALTVSTVEWSVAEKTAKPSSVLEGYMWDKETEVDRFRERVPLANLVSQCRLSASDPAAVKPRDWLKPLTDAIASDGFVIIPELKRSEPTIGSIRKKYDLNKLTKIFVEAKVPVLCVNCDQILFGGSLDDVSTVRQAATTAAIDQASEDGVVVPPLLASDLLLYPYQLYKLRLAGADAVNLIVGALEKKDLIYLTKIASTLQLQCLATVTSEIQIQNLSVLTKGGIAGVIVSNRELEDFSFDMSGEQALRLLKSDALKSCLETHGSDIPVLVEGRVGMITRRDSSGTETTRAYLDELKAAGANAAIVGGGLAIEGSDTAQLLESLRATV